MTCYDYALVRLRTADGSPFAKDAYVIKVTFDGGNTVATCTVPDSSFAINTCADLKVSVSLDGPAIQVMVTGTPQTIGITLEASGKKLAEETVTPS